MYLPFSIPTLTQLRASCRAFFAARLPGADTTLRRNNIGVSADAMAGVVYEQYGFLATLANQLFPATANHYFLLRFAARYGMAPKGPTTSAGNVILSGTAGIPIPGGSVLLAQDGVTEFATQQTTDLSGSPGAATIPIVALTAGSVGNLAPGAVLTLTTAIAGVYPTGNVDSNGLTGGTDTESDESLLARVQAREQNPPQGGSATDWWQWALAIPNATRAWVFPGNSGPGTVDVAFVIDTRTNIIPLTADLTAGEASIAALGLVPVTVPYTAFALVPDAINITINNLVPVAGTTSATAQANILAELADLFARLGTPGNATVGSNIGTPGANPPGVIDLEQIDGAIEGAAGVLTYDLVAPTADYSAANGHIPILGTVTF